MPRKASAHIRLKGIHQNNLKGFDLDLPLGKLIAVTGLSGAGKSSFAFETLHAEGQRRYVETFSAYTRQFLDLLDPPSIEAAENICPSIAIRQRNTVKTSRSTVGTMTELCDFFKIWFCHVSTLFDPDTGEAILDDTPQTIWRDARTRWPDQTCIVAFRIQKPEALTWTEVFDPLKAQGYTRVIVNGCLQRLGTTSHPISNESCDTPTPQALYVVQDRLALQPRNRARFIEAVVTALHFGQGDVYLIDANNTKTTYAHYAEGLRSAVSGKRYRPASPPLFSFNSPIGACPACRGFGRVIEIDYARVIPDQARSLDDGAIQAFQGAVYGESQRDLMHAVRRHNIRHDIPWRELTPEDHRFVFEGEPGYHSGSKGWYGLKRFFDWLESTTYKMHVRVFLSKYRAYTRCVSCQGRRLQPEALNWKWRGHTLPDLYALPLDDLFALLKKHHRPLGNHQADLAADSILTRLDYLRQVGLGYLTLDRTSRTLSGGEVERVNLTTCLGTSLVDTLFVLDEPSVGLHSRDVRRLIHILKRLTALGNTVVVVEHDEALIRAADHIIELGPEPGSRGGDLTFSGSLSALLKDRSSLTGAYLSGRKTLRYSGRCGRPVHGLLSSSFEGEAHPCLHFHNTSKHNLKNLSFHVPLHRLVGVSGVSGSGKSTLLNNVIYQGLLRYLGQPAADPATIESLQIDQPLAEVVRVDQGPISRTPRSNPALFCGAWEAIRATFASTQAARKAGMTAGHFSFNSGDGRCPHCEGLGHERIEMQFLADVFVPCSQCDGRRFRSEILAVAYHGKTVADVLDMEINEAIHFFVDQPKIQSRLQALEAVGLGYLPLGQPLNTLSGGESQRLKLVTYLARFRAPNARSRGHALLLLDEPTTGLHRHDVGRLLDVLHQLVEHGHSLVIVEHNLDILKSVDWLIEMGPEAGEHGGTIVACGPPETVARSQAVSASFLRAVLDSEAPLTQPESALLAAAEAPATYTATPPRGLSITGARQNNLKNLSLTLPHGTITVLTGVSGSGKSSLAFDIIFAEGQRRFMESMSPYARQFVEQLPKPDVDRLVGIPPTVAIEQRVTHGTRKSTVATITEVAQYLRLLYARLGVQHNPKTGQPVVALSPAALRRRLSAVLTQSQCNGTERGRYLCAPVVRGRKGHYQPLADWAASHGYTLLRCDGVLTPITTFQKLDRYREHDIEIVVAELGANDASTSSRRLQSHLDEALRLGKGTCFLLHPDGRIVSWFSTVRTDPDTGESFPELDPKHFSWNSSKGWCPTCRGHGRLYQDKDTKDADTTTDDALSATEASRVCPDCKGARLNPDSCAVKLFFKESPPLSLPDLLRLPPKQLLQRLDELKLDRRGQAIVSDIRPQINERLRFMNQVGIDYLTLDRATATLSSGEAQRIRLAAQLGSTLSGVLYVLDEPSIGLHARDNDRLLDSLERLRSRGNSLLIVEHDASTMRRADRIIDIGPGAGTHGGELVANGSLKALLRQRRSLTGRCLKQPISHPLLGHRRTVPLPWDPQSRKKAPCEWLIARGAALRNLKGHDLHLPLNRLTVVCGVSGAGKSTLIRDLLKPAVVFAIHKKLATVDGKTLTNNSVVATHDTQGRLPMRELRGGNAFRRVIEVDQSPIGKTPRSTPATYIGAFDLIRSIFASLPEAKMRGATPGSFSFNTKGGRCEKCRGAGRLKLEMNFLPETYIDCEECNGNRYGAELSDIRFKEKNIAEVLELSFEAAATFFDFHPRLQGILALMVQTGLGYLTLGQSSPTLSGGEAQRLKLVSELTRGLQTVQERNRGIHPRNLYILEEPTIGLHLSDCERLTQVLHRLVDQGHTVVVIEHHLDIIAEADYIVEIGPEGGDAGGAIVYQGPVEGLLACEESPTAPFLEQTLSPVKAR